MLSTSSYDRGITFAVDSNGAGTAGWRLGKWHSGDARDSSKLVVDGQIFAKGGHTDEYDYYANDYSAYYSTQGGTSHWTGDGGWQTPGIVSSTAIQIQSGNYGASSRKPQLQFHQYGYGGIIQEYDGPNKVFHIKQTGDHRLNYAQLTTNYGYLQFGPQNSSFMHFQTDRGRFYFNKRLIVDEGIVSSYSQNLHLQRNEVTKMTIGNTIVESHNTSFLIGGSETGNSYNTTSSTRLLFGGGNEPNDYYIGTNMEDYGGNYTKLDLRWHTGIRMGAQPGYGGIRFYNNEDLSTLLFSVGRGDTKTRVESGEFRLESGVHLNNVDGYVQLKRTANAPLILDRLGTTGASGTSRGDILNFKAAGNKIGRIGYANPYGSVIYMATGNASGYGLGIYHFSTASYIFPTTHTGAINDNAMDIGGTSSRFDDVYATNGTIQTSDRNEKQDIQALTDAEQAAAVACKALVRRFRWIDSVEEKGDNARYHFGVIAQDVEAAFTAEGLDAGDYGLFIRSTWWEHEGHSYPSADVAPTGAVERTRLGIRYNQLLAFIISAI
jgi:hypothetical protein